MITLWYMQTIQQWPQCPPVAFFDVDPCVRYSE